MIKYSYMILIIMVFISCGKKDEYSYEENLKNFNELELKKYNSGIKHLENPSNACKYYITEFIANYDNSCDKDFECEEVNLTECGWDDVISRKNGELRDELYKRALKVRAFCPKCKLAVQPFPSIPICKNNKCEFVEEDYYCKKLSELDLNNYDDKIFQGLKFGNNHECLIDLLDDYTVIDNSNKMKMGEKAFMVLIKLSNFDPKQFLPEECLEDKTEKDGLKLYLKCVENENTWMTKSHIIKGKWTELEHQTFFFR